jgi:class 3 adenylate cyclase/tetratricopeptide (TPR) repeat protein
MTVVPPRDATAADRPDERRHLTVLFSDLVGSTELTSTMDPEDFHDLMDEYQLLIAAVIAESGGVISQFQGDGVVAYFGYPEADESSSRDAVNAGLRVSQAVSELGSRLPPEYGISELHARVGINTGTCVVASIRAGGPQRIADVFGEVPNLAARLQGVGSPGQVIISDTTAELVSGFFELESVGALTLKGIARQVPAFRALRPSAARTRLEAKPLTRFIPRSDASAWLDEQWSSVRSGPGRLVLLTGEAGIGKSRLLREFTDSVSAAGHDASFVYCSRRNALSPLQPFGLVMGEVPLSPDSAASWVRSRATERPALFVVEDVHWADPSTIEAADLVAQSDEPVLVVMTARPDVHDNPQIRPAHELQLERMTHEAARAIIAGVPGGAELSDEVFQALIMRAGGVPLFLEELTRGVVEHQEDSVTTIPVSLTEVITARLDRLGPTKHVAQLAAIVGRTFDRSVLQTVSGLNDGDYQRSLDVLIEHSIVEPPSEGEDQLWFRHALIHEAAYGSVLRPNRREAHSRVGDALIGVGRAEHQPELVAYHLGAAGRVTEALDLWQTASRMARRNFRFREAAGHERELLALLPLLPEADRDVLELASDNRLIMCLATIDQGSPEVADLTMRVHELARPLGDLSAMLRTYLVMVPWCQANGDYAGIDHALAEARSLATEIKDDVSLGLLEQMEGAVRIWQGRLEEGLEQLGRSYTQSGLPIEASLSDLPPLPAGVVMLLAAPRMATGLGCWLAGRVADARRIVDNAHRFVIERSVPQAQAVTAATSAIIAQLDGDRQLTARLAREAVSVSDEVTTRQWRQWGLALRWWAGEGEAEPELPRTFLRPYFLMLLADRDGVEPERALSLLTDALFEVRSTTERFCEAEILRLRGRVLTQLGQHDLAEASLAEALASARGQHSRMLELRALTDRTRLHPDERFRKELASCVAALEPEGVTKSLAEARQVLDRLG